MNGKFPGPTVNATTNNNVIVNVFNALGKTGALPPIIAIVAPQISIIAGACVFITSFDTI